MKTWKWEDFKKLCIKKGFNISQINEYWDTLLKKKNTILFYEEKYKDTFNNFFSSNKKIIMGELKFEKAMEECKEYTISATLNLHSMSDTLAQIINQTILNIPLPENDVSLQRIEDQIDNNTQEGINLKNTIDIFIKSPEFQYINAFANTYKHIKVIKRYFRAEYGKTTRNEQGIVFRSFCYKNRSYNDTWAIDVLGPYKKKIFGYISDIGNSINKYLI